MPTINKISTLQYLGSKSRMIESICLPIIQDPSIHQVVDLFAGTGSVGYALAPYKAIISNDLEYYAYVLNDAILNGCLMNAEEIRRFYTVVEGKFQRSIAFLSKVIAAEEQYLSMPIDSFEVYASFSNNTPSVFSRKAGTQEHEELSRLVSMVEPGAGVQRVPFPCLFTTYFANAYFGIRQCCQIDAIASTILELADDRQRNVLLSVLMTVASSTASSTTHFAQYLTVKSKSTFKNIRGKRSADIIALFKETLSKFDERGLFAKSEKRHICLNLDYEACLRSINIDEHTLVYADPPYFKEHYSRYYHVLNTICLYDYPELAINPQSKDYSIGRYRADRNVSDFGKRAKAISAFSRLIKTCAERKAGLLISYSENSLVKIYEIIQLAKVYYNVRVIRVKLMHSSQGRATESNRTVKEFLLQCSLPDTMDTAIERVANSIKEIKPIVDNPGGFIHNYMARKPFNVVSAIIDSFSAPGDLIYDPMFGSGTTLIEASKLGRRAIGVDLNPVANEICTVSLRRWDLSRINVLIDDFVAEVEKSCSDIYVYFANGEEQIIERCHFCFTEAGLVPTAYWYKERKKGKLSGRKKAEVSTRFLSEYEAFDNVSINRIRDHQLIPNSRIAIKENATVFSYFCKRNLRAIDRIISILDTHHGDYGYEVLRLLVSSSINLIKLSDKKASSQMPYWLPKENATSRNAVLIIQQKAEAMKEGLRYLQDQCKSFVDDGSISVFCSPAQNLSKKELPDNCVDLVVTDPPYTDQVPYLEYNQLWLYLLEMEDKYNLSDELVVSDAPSRKKSQDDFDEIFNQIVRRSSSALKPSSLFVMFYHTFDLKSWSSILTMMHNNGLRYVYQIPTAAPRKSFKTIMSPKSTLDGNYLLFFIKDSCSEIKEFSGDLSEAIEMAEACADRIIRSQAHVTTQDLYDQGMLKEAFEDGYLLLLSEKYKTFADVLKGKFKHENGYWEALE